MPPPLRHYCYYVITLATLMPHASFDADYAAFMPLLLLPPPADAASSPLMLFFFAMFSSLFRCRRYAHLRFGMMPLSFARR